MVVVFFSDQIVTHLLHHTPQTYVNRKGESYGTSKVNLGNS